ncbi:MAG: hypothetical protein RL662_1045 [Bacteroidota bacterium]|jgi:hypothetical protein
MKDNEIHKQQLVDAFYEGETSIEEEHLLYTFFSKESVPKHLFDEQKVFNKLKALSDQKLEASLKKELNILIDQLAEAEEPKVEISKKRSLLVGWKSITGIAASIIILLSLGIYSSISKDEPLTDTYTNEEQAYIETQKTLLYVANKLNKGFDEVEIVEKELEKTTRLIKRNIKL